MIAKELSRRFAVVLTTILLCSSLYPAKGFASCTEVPKQKAAPQIEVSNLGDAASKEQLESLMEQAEISKERRDVFWKHVLQFNNCPGMEELIKGYRIIDATKQTFDAFALQDAWQKRYPDFPGYNCRITAYSLIGDKIKIKDTSNPDASSLFLDKESLNSDGTAMLSSDDMAKFLSLFSTIPGINSLNSSDQAVCIQEAWKKRGVCFNEDSAASLITVYLHDQFDGKNELFAGHAGVLIDLGEDNLYFIEKLAFQAPYRIVKLKDRKELIHYLLAMYDLSFDQPTAPPIIMENDRFIGNPM